MKTRLMILVMVLMCFSSISLNAQVVGIEWNTFLGSDNTESSNAITLDSSGKIYVVGFGWNNWGTPVNAYSGGGDVIVACLDNSGNLLWHTFLGSSDADAGKDIILDSSGNIYVIGISYATWGSPVSDYTGGIDIFVACLDSSGNLIWNGFYGSANNEWGNGITLDSSGNIYIAGFGTGTWGSPVNAFSGMGDINVACLNNSGNRLWNTFLGSSNGDSCEDIALDSLGRIYVTGASRKHLGIADKCL